MLNLDFLAAKYAPGVLKIRDSKEKDKKESLINQALGILSEQGPFALMLWADTKCKNNSADPDKIGDTIWKSLVEVMKTASLVDEENYNNLKQKRMRLETFRNNVFDDFLSLIVTRQLFDRVLTYARYYAKAEVQSAGE